MKTPEEITAALKSVFGNVVSYDGTTDKWSVMAGRFNAGHLFRACEAIGCAPEDILWNPDLDYSLCYYASDAPNPIIAFKVKR